MKTLVLYDSAFGNTEQIARAVAKGLEPLSEVEVVPVGEARLDIFAKVDLLVVGSPTQKWSSTPAIKAFLDASPGTLLDGLATAVFDTRFHQSGWITGSAAKTLAKQLRKHGVSLILPPESFFVTESEGPLEAGELERAEGWGRSLVAALPLNVS
jgi:flavodoxin